MSGSRPWITALEMQFSAMRLFGTVAWDKFPDPAMIVPTREIIANLRKATAYHWSAAAVAASALASKSLPNTTRLSQSNLPDTFQEPMWWWFEQPLPWRCDTQWGANLPIAGLLAYFDADGTLCLATFVNQKNAACFAIAFPWEWGDSIIETFDRRDGPVQAPEIPHLLRFFLSASAWLNQRVCLVSQGSVKRYHRKQLARGLSAPIESDVKVIQLRRAEAKPHQADSTGSESVDWSCRWVVNGHWRNQPYKDEHKLIYILPYMKGPDDKPLKVPTHTVYEVSR